MLRFITLTSILCSMYFSPREGSSNTGIIPNDVLSCQEAMKRESLSLSSDDLIRCYRNDLKRMLATLIGARLPYRRKLI